MFVILNVFYYLLKKVGNPTPLFGASGLVSLMIGAIILNVVALIDIEKNGYFIGNGFYAFGIFISILSLVYFYAKKHKAQIQITTPTHSHFFVVGLLLSVIVALFIICANENRERLTKLHGVTSSLY